MNKGFVFRIAICVFVFSFFLYLYTDYHNQLTQLRFRVPEVTKKIQRLQEENKRLQYQIDQFESPDHLMCLARRSEFSHLKQPLTKDILQCQEGLALQLPENGKVEKGYSSKATLATVR